MEGGKTVDAPVTLDRIPLYVRAGSIIPMGPDMEYAAEKPADPIELRIYRGADARFTLYEDENDTYNYEKGATQQFNSNGTRPPKPHHRRPPWHLSRNAASRQFKVVFVAESHGAGIGATAKANREVSYEGKTVTVKP